MTNPVLIAALGLAIAFAEVAAAQNPPTPPATRGGGATAAGGAAATTQPGRGGRGGGRGNVRQMVLSTSGWRDGDQIPVKYSQAGQEVSPPLSWSGAPEGTAGFVLLMHDLNAFDGGDTRLHWLLWNIPATATQLPEGLPQGPRLPDGTRQISRSGPYYRGPAAAPSDSTHHYVIELFAVDTLVNVEPAPCPVSERCAPESQYGATRTAVMAAIQGRIRGKAVLFGLYRHPRG